MYPSVGHRVISTNTDIIFEKQHPTNYTRICLPGLDNGFITYIRKFCNFYKCNFSKDTFNEQVKIYKDEANRLFKSNFDGTLVNKAYLHRKIRLCNIGLDEDWHSPVFVIKINSHIMATTGHNKIYATALRKKNYHLDFDCFVMDFDNDLENKFINVDEVHTDKEFSDAIGSDQFAMDISIEKTIGGFVPCVMQFSKEYPIEYHNGSSELTDGNLEFFKNIAHDKINIEIQDTYNSTIVDSSGVFNVVGETDIVRPSMTFITNRRIRFDLSDLLPFFTLHGTSYVAIDGSYRALVDRQPLLEKKSPPSILL
jgi:hypothetical protein